MMTFDEYVKRNPDVMVPTYCGQSANAGRMEPHLFPKEAFATLRCGNTEVRLGYSALSLMAGWLSMGAHGYSGISKDIIAAFNSIVCEAAIIGRAE